MPARKAKAETQTPRNGRLEEAMALLIQNQASFLARVSEMDRVNSKLFAGINERLTRIEAILAEHSRILAEHSRLLAGLPEALAGLPEAVRQKIGFQSVERQR